jgi:hypothetical protein
MIIDTHFHAFPGKYLDLMPDSQNDVRGGLSCFRSSRIYRCDG